MLVHVATGFFCRFGFRAKADCRQAPNGSQPWFHGEFFLQRSPGEVTVQDDLGWVSWDTLQAAFEGWLTFIKRETTEPDFWKVLPPSELLPALRPSASNEPFTADERRRIAASLNEIWRDVLQVVELSEHQRESFNATVQEMKDSSERLGRKDWMNAFLGGYLSWVVTSALGSRVAQSVFDFIATKLTWVWSEIPKLLG